MEVKLFPSPLIQQRCMCFPGTGWGPTDLSRCQKGCGCHETLRVTPPGGVWGQDWLRHLQSPVLSSHDAFKDGGLRPSNQV